MAAAAVGCGSTWAQFKDTSSRRSLRNKKCNSKGFRVSCVSSTVSDPYQTLSIRPGASESEIKKAFRQLALKYHPDVCRGSNCGVQFHQINEAYNIVMSNVRGESSGAEMYDEDEQNEQDWDLWEEWMGWEGAGIRDYSSHINPYI
ncbi:chaperone protein dnaJ 8, chloroplastic-like [Salvia miltiorrhiza]|uniref:chaperone protein dnaJ 8, chloroplastic-like n=1 Tax=Salvia miltiorrhiza TaxID=226208 RepID=UPI0025AD596E|nr:chaperone protein dnaJ 8, chloroplastic-like [Salvia miltiorrhiza]